MFLIFDRAHGLMYGPFDSTKAAKAWVKRSLLDSHSCSVHMLQDPSKFSRVHS